MPTYTIEGTAEFYDQSLNQATIKDGTFFDSSKNDQGGAVDNAIFQDTAENKGNIVSTAVFDERTKNASTGTASAGASILFKGYSENEGTITSASFIGNAANEGTVTNARFADTSSNRGTASNAVIVSNAVVNTGTISTSLERPTGWNTTSGTVPQSPTTFTQAAGAFSYGYFNESGNSAAPANYSTTAYVALDTTNIYYVYAFDGGVVSIANGNFIEGGTNLKRVFANGIKTSVSVVTLNGTDYYYSGSLATGVTTLYTTKYLVTKVTGSPTGTDSINGTNSTWSVNGQGVLTFSSVASYSSIVIEGTTYYYQYGQTWDDGNTILYSNTALTTVASQIEGIIAVNGATPAQRWAINNLGKYSNVSVYSGQDVGTGSTVYANNTSIANATAIYNSNGATISSGIIVASVSTSDGFTSNAVYRFTFSNEGVLQPDKEVFSITLAGSIYFIDDSDFKQAALLYDVQGNNVTNGFTPVIFTDTSDYQQYRITVSSGVFAAALLTSQMVGSANYLVDASNYTYGGNGALVTDVSPAITGGSYLNSVDSTGLFVSVPVTQKVINSVSYYLDAATSTGYNSNGSQINSEVYHIVNVSGTNYREGFSSSGTYSSETVYEVTAATGTSTSYYINNSTITSATALYDADGGSPNLTATAVSYNSSKYVITMSSAGGAGVIEAVDQVYELQSVSYSYSAGLTDSGSGWINNVDPGQATKIFIGNARISDANTGFFKYSGGSTYYSFSVNSTSGAITTSSYVGVITDITGSEHFQFLVSTTTFTTGVTTVNMFGQNITAIPFISESSGNYTRWNNTYNAAAHDSTTAVYPVTVGYGSYYSTSSNSVSNGDYLYSSNGAPATSLNVENYPSEGQTLTTDANGQVTITS